MTQLQLFKNDELQFDKTFDRVVLILDRRAPTDKNLYFRISADKSLNSDEFETLISHMEEVENIKGIIFDGAKIIFGNNSEQSFTKNIFLNLVQFEPQENGTVIERIVFVEVE